MFYKRRSDRCNLIFRECRIIFRLGITYPLDTSQKQPQHWAMHKDRLDAKTRKGLDGLQCDLLFSVDGLRRESGQADGNVFRAGFVGSGILHPLAAMGNHGLS